MNLEIFGAYFTNWRTATSIIIPLTSILFLYLFFRINHNSKARSWSLGLMLTSSIFLWLFLGLSLALCYASADAYQNQEEAILPAVLGRAILFSLVAALPLAIMLRRFSPQITMSKVKRITLPRAELRESFTTLKRKMGIPSAELRISRMNLPISFALDAKKPLVVISERLLTLLKKDELEAVMAHELAHVKNSDTALKALVTAYKAALPHDPIIRLVEAAFHREREMVADETAARITMKPLSLASALLKIYEAFPKNNMRSYGTLSILGVGYSLVSHNPPIIHRVNRLIHLAEPQRQA